MSKPILGYWHIRGLAQPVRFMMAYAKVDYEDKTYKAIIKDGKVNREAWFSEKFNLGLEFSNLPYYIDGDLKLVQSSAIIHHVARKYGLAGKNESEMALAEMIEGVIGDYRSKWTDLCYDPEFEIKKGTYVDRTLVPSLIELEKYLVGKTWFAGDLTFADFIAYEYFAQNKVFRPDLFDDKSHINTFMDHFKALPGIKECSMRTAGYPLNNISAAYAPTISAE